MIEESLAGRVRRAIRVGAQRPRGRPWAVHESSERYDWTGVYVLEDEGTLVLSHFIGEPTPHTRIPMDSGICGATAMARQTLIVPDVGDPRYLSCSLRTKSEIVAPIMKDGQVLGEIDIDSHAPDAFRSESEELEQVAALLAEKLSGEIPH